VPRHGTASPRRDAGSVFAKLRPILAYPLRLPTSGRLEERPGFPVQFGYITEISASERIGTRRGWANLNSDGDGAAGYSTLRILGIRLAHLALTGLGQALNEKLDAFILSSWGHPLVDIEEHRECSVS